MFSLAELKSFFHLESLDDKENRYKTILSRIELLKSEQNDLIFEHEEEKKIAITKLKNINSIISSIDEADHLSKAINDKYNKYFTYFVNRLAEIKKDYNKQEQALKKLYANDKFEKAQQIKDTDFLTSLVLVAELKEKGELSEEAYLKIKQTLHKGGYPIGTIRNWADGKYRKDPPRYGKEIWTKVSETTSGSGASASALRTELEKIYDVFKLKKKIESIPDKYKDSPLAKMARQIYAEKDERDWKQLRSQDLDRLEKNLASIKSRSYYSDEQKAFYIERYEKVIVEKQAEEKLSPMEIEAAGIREFPVGTVRNWKDGKYIKEADGTWRKMPDTFDPLEIFSLKEGDFVAVVEDDKITERILASGTIKTIIKGGEGEDTFTKEIEVEDDDTGNIITVKFEDMDVKGLKLYKGSVKGFIKKKSGYIPFPLKIDKLKTTKSLGGSSDVKLTEWDGKTFALKTAREDKGEEGKKQLKYEYIANSLYRLMGIKVPVGLLYEDGKYLLNNFEEGKQLSASASTSSVKSAIQKGFVMDALLGNWDVIGGAEDNILVHNLYGEAIIKRIDNGGCFFSRARGGKKDYGVEVTELETLKKHNPKWFGDISDSDIKSQIDKILEQKSALLSTLEWESNQAGLNPEEIKELYTAVNSRLSWLENWKSKELELKGEYGSIATNTYFQDWEGVEVPSTIDKVVLKKNIVEKEKEYERYYERYARERGISVEEYKSKLQERMEAVIARSEFFITAHPENVDKIFNINERFLSQFETGSSRGMLNPKRRADAELTLFGTKIDIEAKDRCIYGYWTDNTNGVLNGSGENPPPNDVRQYGSITFKVNRTHALKYATITFRDSLDWGVPPETVPILASKPHFTGFRADSGDPLKTFEVGRIHQWEAYGYTEVQYHKGLSVDKIDSVHICPGNEVLDNDINHVLKSLMHHSIKRSKPVETRYYTNK